MEKLETKDLLIKELIRTIKILSDSVGFTNYTHVPSRFLDGRFENDENFLEELKQWNSNNIPNKDSFKNPETFIMLSSLIMAQESCDPETFEKFLESYNRICEIRKLNSFQKFD